MNILIGCAVKAVMVVVEGFAEIPRLTADEWALLREDLSLLPKQEFLEVSKGIMALTEQCPFPLVCPMLNQAQGICLVYAHCTVTCRTYGFYVQRDKRLYCQAIEERVLAGDWKSLIWGNQDVIDHQLNALGNCRALMEWFALWQAD